MVKIIPVDPSGGPAPYPATTGVWDSSSIDFDANWREEWYVLVGRFMLAFGEIELFTAQTFATFAGGSIEAAALIGFSKRTEWIRKKLKPRDATDTDVKRFRKLLSNALIIAEYRNLIAHNPLKLSSFYFNTVTGEAVSHDGIIQSAQDQMKNTSKEKLQEAADDAKNLFSELYIARGMLPEFYIDQILCMSDFSGCDNEHDMTPEFSD